MVAAKILLKICLSTLFVYCFILPEPKVILLCTVDIYHVCVDPLQYILQKNSTVVRVQQMRM